MTADRRLLYAASFLRALATGMMGVLLALYLARLGLGPTAIGAVVAAGLAGAASASLLATMRGDRWGRRRLLVALGLLGAAGGIGLAAVSDAVAVAVIAFLGMANGMGRDRGAALVIDQAVLPATAADRDRTRAFAWYNVLQDAGLALGALLAGLPALLEGMGGLGALASLRVGLGLYAALMLGTAVAYARLSPDTETVAAPREGRVSDETRRVLWRVSSLFALDSFGGGFVPTALLSLFFHQRFGVGAGTLGLLFFGARVANALSHLGAAWLAGRIGLVNTMVFTHVPSSLLLVTVPFAPTFPVAALLFLVREGLVEMDVPTRQSYVMAVVRPEERTLASGVTHLVRLAGWATAPAAAGVLMQGLSASSPFVVGAALKLTYDVLLYTAFRTRRPPEEVVATVAR